jgi:hypothetical protein
MLPHGGGTFTRESLRYFDERNIAYAHRLAVLERGAHLFPNHRTRLLHRRIHLAVGLRRFHGWICSAKALGLEVPTSILLRATEVIE